MTELGQWLDAPSLTAGALIAAGLVDAGQLPDIDLRQTGLRIRPGDAGTVQELRIVLDAVNPTAVQEFWRTALGYRTVGDHRLIDPLHRDPDLIVQPTDDVRPLRNRFHIDVVRPAPVVEAVRDGRTPTGAWGVMLADTEGNEVDLVPGAPLASEADDWETLFTAMTFYPTASAHQAIDLVTTVAELADAAGIPVGLDIRPEGVVIDHGKDLWEQAGEPFVELATRIQTAARARGLTARKDQLRFVQLGIDAVDVPAVQAFWTTTLGYTQEPQAGDSFDPRRLNPLLIFQQLDASETERRRQRNRLRLELEVAPDQFAARVEQALAAGGQVRAEQPDRCSITDPEGNELDIIAAKPL